jgi:hypothetical protein
MFVRSFSTVQKRNSYDIDFEVAGRDIVFAVTENALYTKKSPGAELRLLRGENANPAVPPALKHGHNAHLPSYCT